MQKFEPDQLVLVREKRETVWRLTHYSHRIKGEGRWSVTIDGKVWEPCNILPYSGNEQLLGTTGQPTPKWEPKPGELVAVRRIGFDHWVLAQFKCKIKGQFQVTNRSDGQAELSFFDYCEPLRDHFTTPEE